MEKIFFVIVVLFCLSNCGDDESIEIENVQIYSDSYFKRYQDYNLTVYDSEIQENESLILAGNGKEENSVLIKPFFLKINPTNEISKLDFLELDNRSIYRDIHLLPSQDEKFIYLSTSTENEFSTNEDIDIRKMTEDGEIVWEKRIGEVLINERGSSVIQLPNEDYIILSIEKQASLPYNKYFIVRISGSGDLIWSKTIEDDRIYFLNKILYLPSDNSFLVLGEYDLPLASSGRIKITKFDLDGNVISSKLLLENIQYWPISSNMKLLEDETVLVYFSSIEEGTENDHEIQIKNLESDLSELWSRSYNEIKSDIISDAIQVSDGNLILLSKSSNIGNGGFDVILSKVDISGGIMWRKVFGTSSSDQGNKVKERMNNNLVIIGNTNHDTGQESVFDLFLIETNSEGEPF